MQLSPRTTEPIELDPGRLRAIFFDLFGRPPFSAERRRWLGRGVGELLDEVLGGVAFWDNWLEEQLYYFLLIDNFRPTSEKVRALPAELADGRIGIREALHRIVISASFDRRNPGPDTFVTVVMEQLLGTTVQNRPRDLELGKRMYDGARASFLGRTGSSQADVVRIAIEDSQAMSHFVEREHRRVLGTEPAPRELAAWARELSASGGTHEGILRQWLLSEEYERRLTSPAPLSNRAFVRALHVDLFDRLPDEEEAQRLRGGLDGLADARPLRSILARLLVGAAPLPPKSEIQDPTSWVAGLFEQLLGRSPGEEELRAFVTAFHDPSCEPSTVVYAIVSHPEYQTR